MSNIKCLNLVIFSSKIRMKQIFTMNKPNIIKKSKYQQHFHCFIFCILVPYAFWFSYWQDIVTILVSATFRGVALIRGRGLFQCGYPKVQCLFEVWHILQISSYELYHGCFSRNFLKMFRTTFSKNTADASNFV